MENVRFVIIIGILSLLSPFFVFGYEPETAHKGLTSEVLKLYEQLNSNVFTNQEQEWVKGGAVDEDSNVRPLRHFYDPVNNKGLLPETKKEVAIPFTGVTVSVPRVDTVKAFPSAKEWALNTDLQADSNIGGYANQKFLSYFNHSADYSWDRAVYEYVWGDKQRGLETLGHILHLIEDMTVPEHVRNDAHMPYLDSISFNIVTERSPYEEYTSRFNQGNIETAADILRLGSGVPAYNSLSDYFVAAAVGTNGNFLSKDSMNLYPLPKMDGSVIDDDGEFRYVKGTYGNQDYYVVSYLEKMVAKDKFERQYSINDANGKVMSSYWNILSKEAVKNGAGVIDLFFREVEKERETGRLRALNINPFMEVVNTTKNKLVSAYNYTEGKVIEGYEYSKDKVVKGYNYTKDGVIFVYDFTVDTSKNTLGFFADSVKSTISYIDNGIANLFGNNNEAQIGKVFIEDDDGEVVAGDDPEEQADIDSMEESRQVIDQTPTATENLIDIARQIQEAQNLVRDLQRIAQDLEQKYPVENNQIQNTVLQTNSNTVAVVSPTGSTKTTEELREVGGNGEGVTDEDDEEEVPDDIATMTPRAVITLLNVLECEGSLSGAGCLLVGGELSTVIETDTDDYEHIEYKVLYGDTEIISASTEKTFDFNVLDYEGEVTVYTKLYYEDDTFSNEKSVTVVIDTMPIVINEVAWMGTNASANDEWIELYNRTDLDINLLGWNLVSNDSVGTSTAATPDISLEGVIPARGYFLLERTDDSTVSDVSADQIYIGALSNSGEVLGLYVGAILIDSTPETIGWSAGDNSSKNTMERYDPDTSGEIESNWKNSFGPLTNGLDADDDYIYGTPGERNSVTYIINDNEPITSDIVLKSSMSPYVIFGGLVVTPGAILTIPEGVIIKSYDNNSGLVVYGDIGMSGTEENPVVLTSFFDGGLANTYGSDIDSTDNEFGFVYLLDEGASVTGSHIVMRPITQGVTMVNGVFDIDNVSFEDSIGQAGITVQAGEFSVDGLDYVPKDNGSYFLSSSGDSQVAISNMNIEDDVLNKYVFYTFDTSHLILDDVVFGVFNNSNLVESFDGSIVEISNVNGITVAGYELFDVFNDSYMTVSNVYIERIPDTSLALVFNNSISEFDTVTVLEQGSDYAFWVFNQSDFKINGLTLNSIEDGGLAFVLGNSTSLFKNVYINDGSYIGLWAQGSDGGGVPNITIEDSVLAGFADTALHIVSSDVSVTGTTFADSLIGVYVKNAGLMDHAVVISESIFAGNIVAGLWNDISNPATVTATRNNWGDDTGPYHETENLDGLGDIILGEVIFDPWN